MSRLFTSEWLRAHENKSRSEIPHPQQRERPASLENRDLPETRSTECPVVRFTLRRVNLLDVDAKYGSVKDLLDGLRHAGLIRGDKEGEVDLKVSQEKVDSYALEETLIEVECL
jgi:hypothetical protein